MEKAGHKSTGTTNESEKYCADQIKQIKKNIGGEYFLHGNPDIIFYKNKKFSFYEVKPYKEWIPDKGHSNWNLTSPKRRNLSVARKRLFVR